MHGTILDGAKLMTKEVVPPASWQTKSAHVVLVGGCFDVLHYGHVKFLESAKARGDILVVALENDEFIRKRKKREPFHTLKQRAEILTNLRSVDAVVCLPTFATTAEYIEFVSIIRPSIIAVTSGDTHLPQKRQCAEAVGSEIIEVCDLVPGLSTSTLLNYAHLLHD
jgi:cytidyltransferase-like protein